MSRIHKNNAWNSLAAMLGVIGPLSRSRVMELRNDDPDRPLGAPQRVA